MINIDHEKIYKTRYVNIYNSLPGAHVNNTPHDRALMFGKNVTSDSFPYRYHM
jgi:hypothetical protein